MAMTDKATPRPWRVTNKHTRQIADHRGFKVAKCLSSTKGANFVMADGEAEANAALIVAAVNAYDPDRETNVKALVETIENAMDALERGEFLLAKRSYYYGWGGPEPSPAEWGVSAGYQETAEKSPFGQFADEAAEFHRQNLEETEDRKFLTVTNAVRAALRALGETV